jgi:hemerythrin-like domain-containing protein
MPQLRKSEAFPHFNAPAAGYDDPIGMLLGCHRRIEKKLATLKSLVAHVAAKGVDAEASVAAQGVLHYFDVAASHHHEDEERDLLPMLELRVADPADRAKLEATTERIRGDHEEMARAWARLRKPLEGLAEGLLRQVTDLEVQALIALYERHIEVEETVIAPLAQRWLGEGDLLALGRAMAARRGASFPS